MKEQQNNTVSLLRQIVERRGLDYLREGGGKFFVNAFSEMGGDKQDVRLLRYLTECGAHEDLLDAGKLTPAMQRAYYSQAVQKLCDKTLIPEALAHRVCKDFWQAVYNTQPPVNGPQPPVPQPSPPAPQPVKTAEELFREAQNCQDRSQAVRLLQQAADKGHAEAMLQLGFAYEYGNGIPKDPNEAFRWFRQAADLGLAPAQDRVAYCYDKGFGIARDLDQAIAWCQKSSNQNFPDAARHLRQLEEKKRQEAPDTSANKPEFDIVNGALLKYNGNAAKVTVPGGVTRIGSKAFFGNDSIRSVALPYGLIGLGAEAFAGCRNLREITISGSVIAVNLDVFSGCRKLKKITLESGIQKLIFGDHLDQLGSVTIVIPDSVNSVTWAHMPDSQRAERMKHPKNILASKEWTDRLQDFFSKNPDFQSGKPRPSWIKPVLFLLPMVLILWIAVSSFDSNTDERTRSDLASYNLENSIEDMLLEGTGHTYTYPDGTSMEFYYNDAGQEIYRVYVNLDNEIENLFEARYDSAGRLVYHQIFDGQGNLLRADSYDFHSGENTAQRRITLGNGRNLQGISTFDENGYETFTLTAQDGSRMVYHYSGDGILFSLQEYDPAGEPVENPAYFTVDWDQAFKVMGIGNTELGWTNHSGYTHTSVQGLCGGALKEYSVSADAAFIDTYDPMGNLLEELYYTDGQMTALGSREIYNYDPQGNYTGSVDTFYYGDGNYTVTTYDASGIELSMEVHRFEGEEEIISYHRYETELDDQGREICVREFDGETGQPKSIEEYEYDSQGNRTKRTRTAYAEDGGYSVYVEDGEGKDISDAAYYPSGNIRWQNEYSKDGVRSKWTIYYESGQIEHLTEYNTAGEEKKATWYYISGQTKRVTQYNDAGEAISETGYYENGKTEFKHEYNAAGQVIRYTSYYENGNKHYLAEYNDQGELSKSVWYNEDGTVKK